MTHPTTSSPDAAPAEPTRRARRLVPTLVVGVSGCVALVAWLLLARARSEENQVTLASEPKGVTAVESRPATFRPTRRYVGTLEPWMSAALGPQLSAAYVSSVTVRPGALVKRGEVVATLDCRSASASSRAVASQARALESRQRALSAEAERIEGLLARGFVSQNDVDQKLAQSSAEVAQLDAMRSQLTSKDLAVDDCVLRAPFDGEVASRAADPGAYVHPGNTVVTVVDRRTVRLVLRVPEPDFAAVAPETPVLVRMVAVGETVQGRITRRSPAADATSRTILAEVDLPDAERRLPVGTTAEARLEVGDPMEATEIPLTAARVRGSKASVFIVDGERAKLVQVAVIGEREGHLFVATTLAAGTRVIVEGRGALTDGDPVVVKLDEMNVLRSIAEPAATATAGERTP